jgi:dihydrofolate reductase
MEIQLIVAMDEERGIGKNNDLMWHLPADMKFFKETTLGHIVIMGRKNWDSIPEKYRPLANRENVVLTRNTEFKLNNARVFHSLEAALEHYQHEKERIVFIIGGGEIYRQALSMNCVSEMFITHVEGNYGADTFFPDFPEQNWHITELAHFPKDDKHKSAFTIKKYVKK